jgi:hypothetical protein
MDLDLVSTRIAALVEAIPEIVSSLPYVPDAVTPPCFYVAELTLDYDQSFGGLVDAQLACRVLVDRGDRGSMQSLLKAFMARSGPSSVKAVIEGDPGVSQTLGGACDDLHVTRVRRHQMYLVGESRYYGAEWTVRVIGTDSQE